MKRFIILSIIACCTVVATAQTDRHVQHKPYIDLRPMHFGISVGFHVQDIEFQNLGPQTITYDTDIVVIGAGMAGLSTAIEAVEEGANVIVCEAQEVFGSSTSRSLGFVIGTGMTICQLPMRHCASHLRTALPAGHRSTHRSA